MFSLKDRVALVTGAGQGVGNALADALAAAGGARAVIINDYYQERAEEAAAVLRERGYDAIGYGADVTNYEQVKEMMAEIEKRYGGLHILVNNAGNAGTQPITSQLPKFSESTPEDWAPWIGTNFGGVLNCCHAAIPLLIRHGQGRIITIISDAGRVGEPGYAVYSGAKAGAAGFMRALAKEMGRYMTTVNCVSLASVATEGLAERNKDPEYVKKKLSRYIIRRQGEPSDVAGAVVFLASDAASWITGQTLPVNGGYSLTI